MPTLPAQVDRVSPTGTTPGPRLGRSDRQRMVAGVCGGLGEYFGVDPVWFRIGFVVLALGGGSGFLIYLLMWIIVPTRPAGETQPAFPGSVTGAAVVGSILMVVGTIAVFNTIAPQLGQYFWPVALVMGGLALVIGGLNRDDHR